MIKMNGLQGFIANVGLAFVGPAAGVDENA